MIKPALFTDSKENNLPILIVDKIGILGQELAKKLSQESLVIFLSERNIEAENTVHIPFLKKIPAIPDNTYAHQIIIDEHMELPKDLIEEFIKKAKHDNSSIVLVININFVNQDLIDKYLSFFDELKVVLTGDIFTDDILYDTSSWINKFIKSVQSEGRINIPGDGTMLSTPIYLEDAVLGILQAVLVENEQEKVFFLFPKFKPTLLSIAHTFQKIEPDIKIDFVKFPKNEKEVREIVIDGKYILDENYNLYKAVKKINLKFKKKENKAYSKKEQSEEKNKTNNIFLGIIITVIFFFLMPIISTILFSGIGIYFTSSLKNEIQNENFAMAKNYAFYSYNFFVLSKKSFSVFLKEAEFIRQEDKLEDISEKINQGIEISGVSYSLLESFDKVKKIFEGKSNSQKEDFLKATDDLKNALVIYQKQQQLNNIPEAIESKLNEIVNFTSSTIDTWPEILGLNGKKTYLVLFQNNMELRPGGGFIGSYGILTLDKGRVINFTIHDVYDADGQLKGHVEPPFPIRRYLSSLNWFLRDSNFSTDFSKNAAAAAVFLNSETRQVVDGVIGVDLSFVKNLLSAIGPVNVVDYKETVNSKNLFEVTNSHVQEDFFSGSTKKKDFLRALFNSISLKLASDKNISYLNALQSLALSLSEKHIFFAFNNKNIQSVFAINGWGATLFDNRKAADTNINDYIGISEANLGANKVNYYISRNVSQTTSIEKDGSIKGSLKVDFKNNAEKLTDKKNAYKNYFRVVLPLGANLDNIQIDGKKQVVVDAITDPSNYEQKGFRPPTGLEVEKLNESGKTIYGFLTIIEEGEIKSIIINYTLLGKLNLTKPSFLYSLKVIKQPGIDSFPYEFSLILPENLTAINLPKEIKQNDNMLSTATEITKDKELSISLTKK